MGLNCGLVGLPSCGKTTIYNAITSAGARSYDGAKMNRSVIDVPDPRIEALAEIYRVSRAVPTTLEVVDIPGLKAGSTAKTGHGTKLLLHIKDVDAVLHVVRCFEDESVPFEHLTIDPVRDVETVDIELMVADSQTVERKIDRLAKRVRAGEKGAAQELVDCQKVLATLNEGVPARRQGLNAHEVAAIYDCHLVSLKPVLYIANLQTSADAENRHVKALQVLADVEGAGMITVCGRDEADISQLDPEDRQEFLIELGMEESSMERLIRAAYRILGLVSFFTVNEKEIHAWTCRKGDRAPIAAGKVHTDMEKGFIRMEVIRYEDLIELKSESAVVKAGRQRVEGKAYEVRDGDIVFVRFSPP
ncbi:redox-regulated ATPase YchF [Candidatus Bipolaricaulota bacterium]|nr:redox-regulated ATPase YchF [Candidatus Bipolaricaulota bacterium]